MIFSSQIFLFLFLPVTLLGYFFFYKTKNSFLKNCWLLLMSILFYAYGEPFYVYVLIAVSFLNWVLAKQMAKMTGASRRNLLIVAVIGNSCVLIICKYLSFIIINMNYIFKFNITDPQIQLPVGISFFTFQAISYIIDVYRGDADVSASPLETGVYLLLFPQLIAGPIVRYKSIASEIHTRKENIDDLSIGIERLIIGIGKKVLLANILGETADAIFAGNLETSVILSWIGALCYMYQIYYDFSGYSDMAIGLGRMFGFHFGENFDYPYISKSVTEFWRRWHISLSSWFRDYIYIPLGGSRVSKGKHILNLFIVWCLTGIWHGANWTFVAWGLYYFVFLVIEKTLHLYIEKIPVFIRQVVTMLIVCIGWVLFKSVSLSTAIRYLQTLVGYNNVPFINDTAILYFHETILVLILAVIFSLPQKKYLRKIFMKYHIPAFYGPIVKSFLLGILLLCAISFLVKGSYNPFIYFNF